MLLQARLITDRIETANELLNELGISETDFDTHGVILLSPDSHSYNYHYKGEFKFKLTYNDSFCGYIPTFTA